MLGRTERESAIHAALAAASGGWTGQGEEANAGWDSAPAQPVELLDLGGVTDTLATVALIGGLSAVVHLGHPEQPAPQLEDYLLAGNASLMLTAAQSVAPQWVWVAPELPGSGTSPAPATGSMGGVVVLDEAGLRDCREALRPSGVSLRLVSARTSVAERVALAGTNGSLVIEADRVPAGWIKLPASRRLAALEPVWYGLLEARKQWPQFVAPAVVWLAFGPSTDHRGSLRQTLGVIADAGIDLQHLRSQPTPASSDHSGPHHFFSAFRCQHADVLADLVAELDVRGVANRTLAVLPGQRFVPGPISLQPVWSQAAR